MRTEKEISGCGILKGSSIFTAIAVLMALLFAGCAPERVTGAATIDFKKTAWPGIISKTRGLSGAEPWGTWSTGAVVTLEFSAPLPKTFTVHLVATAFVPSIGKEIVAHVGDSTKKFTLKALPEERVLEFNNPEKSRTIKIDIPAPASPKELGMSSDPRSLGIGLVELRIVPQ
jgi:phosphoglycerol transferase